MLKASPRGAARPQLPASTSRILVVGSSSQTAVKPPPASTSRGLLMASSSQTPANPPPAVGSPDKWMAFVNGGAKEDDARMLQKRREAEAELEQARHRLAALQSTEAGHSRLINTSPPKPHASVSDNVGLLLDLDIDSEYNGYAPQPSESNSSSAGTEATMYAGAVFNLMD